MDYLYRQKQMCVDNFHLNQTFYDENNQPQNYDVKLWRRRVINQMIPETLKKDFKKGQKIKLFSCSKDNSILQVNTNIFSIKWDNHLNLTIMEIFKSHVGNIVDNLATDKDQQFIVINFRQSGEIFLLIKYDCDDKSNC